jgi:hypothetical protein
MEMIWNENLNALRAVIAEECNARMGKQLELNVDDIAERLLSHHRQDVIEGLTDLVNQYIEEYDDYVQCIAGFSAKPKLKQRETGRRDPDCDPLGFLEDVPF